MSGLTLIVFVVVVYGVVSRGGYGRALALGGATASGSAIVVGTTAVPTFYAVAFGAVVALALSVLDRARRPGRQRVPLPPGALLLVLFFVQSTIVTLIAPLLFDQMPIVTPVATELVAGQLTSSNLAQIVYLFLGVCVVVFLARSPHASPSLIGLTTGLAILLSFWRYLAPLLGLPFPEGLFDNSPSFAYIETAAGGGVRFRGIFSEPAAMAGTAVATMAYMLPRSAQLRGWRRTGALAVAAIALYLGVISTSATFVVAGVITAAIAGTTLTIGFLARRLSLSKVVGLLGVVALVVGMWLLPTVVDFRHVHGEREAGVFLLLRPLVVQQ